MWIMPRRLRWSSQASLRNRKGSPPTWRNASRRIPPCNSSIFPRCTPSLLWLIGRLWTRSSDCKRAIPYDFAMPGTAFFAKFGGLYPAYVRGEAYLAAGRGQEAAAEFQKILDSSWHRFCRSDRRPGALATGQSLHYIGRKVKAKSAYHDFLTIWKDADPDIPVLKQANAEYAKL